MKKLILPLIFILLLTFTLIGNCDWLSGGWDQRIKLTIDNTKIDAALSDFPVTIFFDDTQGEEILAELTDDNYMKCAFTASDGTTQLYAEKELFSFISQYPSAQSDTYVKSTTKTNIGYWAYFATDPVKSLTGSYLDNAWLSAHEVITNQRFHIDLGSAKIIRKIYYENSHNSGSSTNTGVQNFTFWGSNTGAGTFDDLVYANDEGWTQLTTSQATFDQHTGSDVADPKYITVTNSVVYRYYAFKFADNYGSNNYMGVRRIELQTGEAIYHVKVTSVASGADTDIYYYYDNDHADNTTYIGAINTTAGGHVWDSNFKAVYHMVDATTSTVVDSTSNNNDSTKLSANNPIETTGKVYKGQDFSNDYIAIPRIFAVPTELTLEHIFKSDVSNTTQQRTIAYNDADDDIYILFSINDGTANLIKFGCYDGTTVYTDTTSAYTVTDYHYIVGTAKENDYANLFVDSVKIGTPSARNAFVQTGTPGRYMGCSRTGSTAFVNGIIDEVRFSNIVRTDAWIKGTYNSLYDTLLTYGNEETEGVAEDNAIFFGMNF